MTIDLLLLVVDDDPINHKLAHAALSPAGWRVDYAEGGEAAIEVAARRRYAVILMDIQMPEMDGYAVTRAIRAGIGASAAAPVLAFTAKRAPGLADRIRAAGMDGHIAKPFTAGQLRGAVEPWRPIGMPAAAERLAATFGEAEIASLIDRFRDQLEHALEGDVLAASTKAEAHKLAGVAGTLGFPDVFRPWLAVSEGDANAYGEARASARRALAQIASRRPEAQGAGC